MDNEVIPEDLKQFLLQRIDSIAQWEGLLLMRADPKKEWSPAELAQRLYLSEAETRAELASLFEQGLVMVIGHPPLFYRYQPQTAELDEQIGRIAELYKSYLVPITHLIHAKPKSRVQEFADAFRLRKEKE